MYKVPTFPLKQDVETKTVLKLLALQEAKDSSAVESIITTPDELYKAELAVHASTSIATKEVQNYSRALLLGFDLVNERKIFTCNDIIKIYQAIKLNNARFRTTPGRTLINEQTAKIVYQPPQDINEINTLMSNLEQFINDKSLSDLDPLVKMAIIQHQIESMHPFSDGNGRTVREKNNWEDWIIFMLKGIEETSVETIDFICENVGITRPTTTSYLNQLVALGLLSKMKIGRDNYYLYQELYNLLMNTFHL